MLEQLIYGVADLLLTEKIRWFLQCSLFLNTTQFFNDILRVVGIAHMSCNQNVKRLISL